MLDLEKLTTVELKLIYDGLMALNYGNYDKNERELIHKMKVDIRIEAEKNRPYTVEYS